MRKSALFIVFALFISTGAFAQFFTLGPRAGISSSDVRLTSDVTEYQNTGIEILEGDRAVGFHGGLFARVTLAGLYIQPEVLFTRLNSQFTLEDPQGAAATALNMGYNRLDVPVMVGKTFANVVRVNLGPTFAYNLSSDVTVDDANPQNISQEDVETIRSDFENNYQDATVGYQVGVGLDIWKIVLDAKYEGSLAGFGAEIQGFATDQRANQFIVSVGFKLL